MDINKLFPKSYLEVLDKYEISYSENMDDKELYNLFSDILRVINYISYIYEDDLEEDYKILNIMANILDAYDFEG